ncbi:hypothetical protein SAMN05216483_1979 [Streptomyces sp. 2131.1]|nr:hypothetical protein SAMN05216483_1979 [Streptomyces sp. 2131.1]
MGAVDAHTDVRAAYADEEVEYIAHHVRGRSLPMVDGFDGDLDAPLRRVRAEFLEERL